MNLHIQKQFIVPQELHSQRLDVVLAQLLPEYSRSQISQWIKLGAILMDKHACKPKDKAPGGSFIELDIHVHEHAIHFNECAPENIPLDIVYEDDEVLILNKSAGLVVHPGAGNREHTLVNALLHHAPVLKHIPRAGIIHRLDKDTTGLLIVAKSLESHTSLIRQMQHRNIHRQYVALVQGHLISSGTIETYFGRHPRNRLKMAVLDAGREAITHYFINKKYKHFTLLDVELMTGRTHQIRVHLSHINHPIVGDMLYGGRMRFPANVSAELRTQLEGFKRQALHACAITLTHPKTGEELSFEAPLPQDFNELLSALDNDDEIL